MIDLRSDTVTQPTAAMRAAIANAPVGDDVMGDDPTVNQLEAEVAALLGKEAAVYMPSGTMTNQVALRLHTEPGDEVILEAEAHIYYYEGGGPAAEAKQLHQATPQSNDQQPVDSHPTGLIGGGIGVSYTGGGGGNA